MNRLRCNCRDAIARLHIRQESGYPGSLVMPELSCRSLVTPARSRQADATQFSRHGSREAWGGLRMVDIRPTDAALGADITGVDLSRPLTSTEFGAIHGAWMDNLVLRFRGQQLSDEQLMTFSRNFGALDGNPAHAKVEGRAANATSGYVNVISNVVENGRPIGGLGNYESKWHTDMSYNLTPPMASALYALEVPDAGGDTSFCNMYAALDQLPAGLRKEITGLSCVHDSSLNSVGQLRVGFE